MATVRKRFPDDPKSPWIVTYSDMKGKRTQKTFAKKKEADAYKQKVEREIFEGVHLSLSEAKPFKEVADLYLRDCDRRRKIKDRMAGNTYDLAQRLFNLHLIPHFGAMTITEITPQQVQDFINEKASTYSRVMVVKLAVHMRQLLQFGVERGCLKRNVLRDQPTRIPLPPQKQIEIPSLTDLQRLLHVVETEPRKFRSRRDGPLIYGVVVYLALTAGLRRGEICGLLWENVDLNADLILVRHSLSRFDGLKEPKTAAGVRDVPMVPALKAKLQELRELQGNPKAGPVLKTRYGNAIQPDDLDVYFWRPIAEAANLRKTDGSLMNLHALRHAAASLWIRRNLPALAVKKAIGHSSVSTTLDVYGHLFPEDALTRKAVFDAASDLSLQQPRTIEATYTRQIELSD